MGEVVYVSQFEEGMWALVQVWTSSALASLQLYGWCRSREYAWSQACEQLGERCLGRGLTEQEQELVWEALEVVGYPGKASV